MLFTIDSHGWGLDGLAVLDVLSSDFGNLSIVGSVSGKELGDNLEFLGSINLELAAWSVEVLFTMSEGSEVTSVLITDTSVSIIGFVVSAVTSRASFSVDSARVSSECLGNAVGFPDVEFHAA